MGKRSLQAVVFSLTFVLAFSSLSPLAGLIQAQSVNVPKASHTPQISVDVPGGMKVNTWNGNLFHSLPLLSIPNRNLPITTSLSYNTSWFETDEGFGPGWQMGQNMFYKIEDDNDVVVVWQDGRSETYDESSGSYTAPIDIFNTLERYDTDKFRLTTKSNVVYDFANSSHKKLTGITDENGNTISLSYSSGKLSSISDGNGRSINLAYTDEKLTGLTNTAVTPNLTVSIVYDSEDRIQTVTDPRGNTISYEYDENNFLKKLTDPKGNTVDITYKNGVASGIIHSEGAEVYFNFDPDEKRTSHIEYFDSGQHRVTRYDYDDDGRIGTIDRVIDGTGKIITESFVWDSEDQLTTYTDTLGRSTNYTYDSNGNITQIVDALSNATSYTYDSEDRLLTSTDARGNTTTLTYDASGNLLTATDAAGNVTTNTYFANGDLKTTTDAKSNLTTFAYDQYGNLTSTTDANSNVTSQTYDNLGRVLTSTDGNSNTTTNEYSNYGDLLKVTDALNNEASFVYDSYGQLTSQTDAESNVTTFEYDSVGRQIKLTDAVSAATEIVYDEHGQLIQLIDANSGVYAYEYDYLGRLIRQTDPEGNETLYEYDAAGNMTAKVNPNGALTSFVYDKLNRLIGASYADGGSSSYEYDANGNVTKEENRDVVINRVFDNLNRVTSVETITNGITKTVSYQYDELGNRKKLIDADGGETVYEYDEVNNLTKITDPDGNVTNYAYDNGYRVISKNLPNGVTTSYAYDTVNRLTELTNSKDSGNTVLDKYAYTYDKVGNRLTQTLNGTDITDYEYDAIYQLERVDYPDSSYQEMTFDVLGNRLTFDEDGSVTSSVYGDDNRIESVGGVSYTHDANGNLLNDGVADYGYDSLNRLTSFDDGSINESYSYYPDGKRLSKTDNSGTTTYYFYDGENVLFETSDTGSLNVSYASSGIDGWLSMKSGSDRNYYVQDGLNSVIGLYDSSASSVNSYSYDAFGNSVTKNETVTNPFEYIGRRNDETNGLYYNRARYYDTEVSRFITKDPAGMVDGVNRYVYAGNNSVNFVDGSGLCLAGGIVGGVLGRGSALGFSAGYAACQVAKTLFNNEPTEKKVAQSYDSEMDYMLLEQQERLNSMNPIQKIGYGLSTFMPIIGYTDTNIKNKLHGQGYTHVEYRGVEHDASGPGNILFGHYMKSAWGANLTITKVIGHIDQILIHGEFDPIDDQNQLEIGDNWSGLQNQSGLINMTRGSSIELPPEHGVSQGLYSFGGYVIGVEGNLAVVVETPGDPTSGGGGSSTSDDWHVTYFSDVNLNHPINTRYIDSHNLDLNWGSGSPDGISNEDNFGARFQKDVYFSHAGEWRFRVVADDGYRLTVDGQTQGSWWEGNHQDDRDFTIPAAGEYRVQLDYFEKEGDARIFLGWGAYYGDGVSLFVREHQDPTEGVRTFSDNAPNLGAYDFNDKAESSGESGGWEATIFEHADYQGEHLVVRTRDDFRGTPMVDNNGDSKVSSIKVRRRDNEKVTLYERGDRNGEQFKTDRTLIDLGHWDKGDWAESITIKDGHEVIVCEHAGFRGECGRSKADGSDKHHNDIREIDPALRNDGGGTSSSVRICEGDCPAAPDAPLQVLPGETARFDPGSDVGFEWIDNADHYQIQLWGGDLGSNQYYETDDYDYTISNLTASENPYNWRIRAWNDYGDGAWSSIQTFFVKDKAIEAANIIGDDTVTPNSDLTLAAAIFPADATNIVYEWTPEPISGQGTAQAVYNFKILGQNQVDLTVSNVGSSNSANKTITVQCSSDEFEAYYYPNKELNGTAASTECLSEIDKDWGEGGPAGTFGYSTGADGDLYVARDESYEVDQVRTDMTGTASAGATEVEVTAADGFSIGDTILIIQIQGPDAGIYETKVIESITDSKLQFSSESLDNTYTVQDSSGYTAYKAQVQRVPQFRKVTLLGTITASDWDRATGGIVAFDAQELNLYENSAVTASGLGHLGGAGGDEYNHSRADTGQTGGSYSYGTINGPAAGDDCGGCTSPHGPANGGAGTGGRGSRGADVGAGGGGGSYGTAGVNGDTATQWPNPTGGNTGSTYGSADLNQIFLGSGGGGGGKAKDGKGYSGGDGGGIILINSEVIAAMEGSFLAKGADGSTTGGTDYSGGGGAGSGGSIYINAKKADITSLSVAGGAGKNGAGSSSGAGGDGGLGRAYIQTCEALPTDISAETITTNVKAECGADEFSARFIKDIDLDGEYRFITRSDDGVRVYLDNQSIIDTWTDGYHEDEVTQTVSPNEQELVIEYYESSGDSQLFFGIVPTGNTPPTIDNEIADQLIGADEQFPTIDLKTIGSDPDGDSISWSYFGNTQLGVEINAQNIATVTHPVGWVGSEEITFRITDEWGQSVSSTASFRRYQCNTGEYLAEYFGNKELSGTPVWEICEDEINHNWGNSGPAVVGDFGTGRDGELTVDSDITMTPIDSVADAVAGTNTISATNSDFAAGQLILLHQTRGAGAGTYQITRIQAYTAGTITTEDTITANYSTVPWTGVDSAQVMVIPEYTDVTITENGILRLKDWDGATGGILYFMVGGVMDVRGIISANGKGYRGGSGVGGNCVDGRPGESYTGADGHGVSLGSGGGGGKSGYDTGGGGGGGAFGPGAFPGHIDHGGCNGSTGGQAGAPIAEADLTGKIYLGSGGGGGGGNNYDRGGHGGDGAGAVIIKANTLNVQGDIDVEGYNGQISPTSIRRGDGGGGSGGYLDIEAANIDLVGGDINISGGNGAHTQSGVNLGSGGDGGVGRVFIDYCNEIAGNLSQEFDIEQVECDHDNFSVRWSGVKNFNSATYDIQLNADDGAKLWIDGAEIIDAWSSNDYTEHFAQEQLNAGNREIVVEYFEGEGDAVAKLTFTEFINNAPVISTISDQTIKFGEDFTSIDLGSHLTEPDGDSVTWEVSGGDNISVSLVNSDELEFSSDSMWIGSEEFTVTATDPYGESANATVTLSRNHCDPGEFEARYYNNKNVANTPKLARCESSVDYDWEEQSPGAGVRANNFSAKWENMFEFEEGGYMFETVSDNGVRLFVDDVLVIDNWTEHEATKDVVELDMTAGQHAVRMEYYDAGGDARAELEWWQPEGGEPQEPGDYEIASHFVAGDSGSVTNTEINPGEEISLGMSILNNTDAEIAKWIVNLSSDNEYVTILDGREVATNIAAGEMSRINGNFQFEVSEKAPINEVLGFTVTIKDQATGQVETYKAHQIVRDPKELPESTTELVSYQDYKILKGGEIGMSKPAYAGEEVEFKLSIHSWLPTSEIRVYIFSDSEYANIIDNYEKATNFIEDTTKLTGRFDVEIDQNTPDGENILFEGFALIKNDDSGGYESVASFEFEIPVSD